MERTKRRARTTLFFISLLALGGAAAPSSGRADGTAVVSIYAAWTHTCAATSLGDVACWGDNGWRQLGDGTDIYRTLPVKATVLPSAATGVAAGYGHTCALVPTQRVVCWGLNLEGQLGNGEQGQVESTPVGVAGLTTEVLRVVAGVGHSCALTVASGVLCWGDDDQGELGNGEPQEDEPLPSQVGGLTGGVIDISAWLEHTCAVTDAGSVVCWGDNGNGQLGDGTSGIGQIRTSPVAVQGLDSPAVDVAAGGGHTCALLTQGSVRCWGSNYSGQLGNGTTVDSSLPVNVSGLPSDVTAVAAGLAHTCALTAGNGVWCWGWNEYGQLGDGTTTTPRYSGRSLPVRVEELGDGVVELTAGALITCALHSDGRAKCWGGPVGDGTLEARTTPVEPLFDLDRDGCADFHEEGADPRHGGLRNPKSFWDFFDTPDAANARDRAVTVNDLARIVARFGSTGDPAIDPLSAPPASGYHPAFDRSPPGGGGDAWDAGPANGAVGADDIAAAVAQFGHTCA